MTTPFDLSSIPWADLKPHSLIVTRLTEERLDQFLYALRDHVGDSVKTVPMSPDAEVLVVDEAMMGAMGWVRKNVQPL